MPSPPQKPATSVHVPISCARACAQCSVPNSAFSVFLFAPGSTSARAHARACKKGTTPLRLQKELRGKKHHPAHPSNELETPLAAQGCLRARRAKADKTQVVLSCSTGASKKEKRVTAMSATCRSRAHLWATAVCVGTKRRDVFLSAWVKKKRVMSCVSCVRD